MDSQSKECLPSLSDISEQSCEQSDSESEDEIVQDTSHMELQTGGVPPVTEESRISKDSKGVVPILNMVFQSENEAYDFYNGYARSVGFSIRKDKSIKRRNKIVSRRVICCSKEGFRRKHSRGSPRKARPESRTNCKARIAIKLQDDGTYVVVEFVEEHNHELAPPSKVHMLRSQRKRNEILKGDAQVLLDYFKRMQRENPSFFYSIQMDKDNHICSCFWCDAKSMIDYSFFSDVVCFDTTYKTNGYDVPYIPIVGVNNHGQTILFGCALLLDETTESFLWLFETFLDAMNGKQPKTIFTAEATPIVNAIKQVFPNTHHRLCLWHIYLNAEKHLSFVFERFDSFVKDFKCCIYDNETEEEFQSNWYALVEKYNLVWNEWLQGLYLIRGKWAQVYGREHFCAGITTAQRSKRINNYFKKFFKRTLSLQEFVTQYEKAVASRREKERIEDCKARQSKPNLLTEWKAEERAGEVYTRKIFSSFQNEYLVCMDLFQQLDGEDGTMYTYKVSSYCGYKPCTVIFDSSDNTVKCSCKKFEFTGILCAHSLKILHSRELPDIPSRYYLKRWTKDATTGVVVDDRAKTMQLDCGQSLTLRYSELANIALTLVVKGASTEKSSALAKRELTRVLEEIDNCLKTNPDQTIPLEDNRSVNNDNVGEESVVDHSGANATLQGPPLKKAKGEQSSSIKVSLDKARRNEIQPQLRKGGSGKEGQSGQVSVRGIERPRRCMAPLIPRVPLHLARPPDMPHHTQGSIMLIDQAMLLPAGTDSRQYRPISGGWSAPPSWHGGVHPLNVDGNPGSSSIQGLTFRPVGPPNMPLIPCFYPYVYNQGLVRAVDQATSHHGTNHTQSSQDEGLLTHQSSTHRLPKQSTEQCPARRLESSEPSVP